MEIEAEIGRAIRGGAMYLKLSNHMYRFILCLLIFIAPCQAARQSPSTQDQATDAGKSEAENFARSVFESHWRKSGDSWFLNLKSGQSKQLLRIDQPTIAVNPTPLTDDDTRKKLVWKGSVSLDWMSIRFFFPNKGWVRLTKLGSETLFVEQKGKRWTVTSLTAPFYKAASTDFKKELKRFELPPEPAIALALQKGEVGENSYSMIAEENRNLFAALFPNVLPRILSSVKPRYSEEAREKKKQGTVILRVEFLADGTIGQVQVVKSVGYGLDENAIEAARKIRFEPARIDDEPITLWARVEYTFNRI